MEWLETVQREQQKKYTMGIDIGTGGVRVGLFTMTGEAVAFSTSEVRSYLPGPGMTEQEPQDWWNALVKSTHEALRKSGIAAEEICGAGISSTVSTLLMLDRDMEVIRPALMWCDVRATEQAELIAATGDPVLKYNGYGKVSAEWGLPKMLWLKENEPGNWARASRICECLDYMNYRLTGCLVSSINPITMRWHYDGRNGGWDAGFLKRIGLEDVKDKFPSTIMELGKPIGKGLTHEAALALGLYEGMPVGAGGCDALLASIGLGITRPGRVAQTTGTSNLQFTLLEKEVHDPGLYGAFPDITIPGYYGLEGGQTASGGVIKWFLKNGFADSCKQQAEAEGCSVLDILNREAEGIPIGSEGLIMLEYLQGNRTPWVDSDVRGLLYGLSLKHTPAHIYRAILEATCYGTALILNVYKKYVDLQEICLSGGLTKSSLYLRILADVTGLTLHIPRETEASCLGAAIVGAVAGGAYADLHAASNSMVQYQDTISPDAENHRNYQFYLKKYEEAYLLMKDWMHEVTAYALK